MSTTPGTPAGWYPDASNGNRLRYWDGVRWTEHFAAPAGAPAQLTAPAGTDPNTPWIWLNLFVPLLGSLPLLFVDWGGLFHVDPSDPEGMIQRQLAIFSSPAYVLSVVLPWFTAAAAIVFAFLDWRELTRRGVPQPFHWAFAFLGSVYPIGRGVVARRRTGRGIAPTYVAIAIIATSFLVGIILAFVIVGAVISQIPTTGTTTL